MRKLLAILALSAPLPALAQAPTAAPIPADSATQQHWYKLHHVVLQAAGSIGLVSGGVGFMALRDRLETDILVGYVPKKYAGSTLSIATAKLLYTPYTVALGEKFQLRPLTVGAYFSYTHGTINDEAPGQYDKGYYWFSTDSRVGILLGGRLSYFVPNANRPTRPRRLSAYYELGTYDVYAVSYFTNLKSLSPTDILTLGLGLKLDL